MAQEAPARTKIPTKSPQPAPRGPGPASQAKSSRTAPGGRTLAGGTGRAANGATAPVIELEYGITVYPARRSRAVAGGVARERRRQQCEAASEEKLAAKLEKVKIGWKPTRRT